MKLAHYFALVWLAGCATLWAGQAMAPVAADAPKIELAGVIDSVQLLPGQGVPFLTVKSEKGAVRVILGSMRYLMERGFNPKAGAEVQVKGFKVGDEVYASSVSLPRENKTIELRDDSGRPLWAGGAGRGQQNRRRGSQ